MRNAMLVSEPKTLSKAAREGVNESFYKESLATGVPGTPYQSGLLQLRQYVPEYTAAHSCFRFLSGKVVKYITEPNPPDSGGKIV